MFCGDPLPESYVVYVFTDDVLDLDEWDAYGGWEYMASELDRVLRCMGYERGDQAVEVASKEEASVDLAI